MSLPLSGTWEAAAGTGLKGVIINGTADSPTTSAYLNGSTPLDQASIDTSTTTTYLINYVATDSAGNTATSTRTVIVGN
jgi:hypothetical protein